VLVVESDAQFGTALTEVLTQRGHEAELRVDARTGFHQAALVAYDCVLANIELPDIDGFWLARRLRTESGEIARTPIVIMGVLPDQVTRRQAFAAGADVVIGLPADDDDIVLQVEAAIRLKERYAATGGPVTDDAAMGGDLATFPLASILMMFELERRSGIVDVHSSGGIHARLKISQGLFAQAELNGEEKREIEVLRRVLSWRAGSFKFRSHDAERLPEPRSSVGALILEAMRLEDESEDGSISIDFNRVSLVPPTPTNKPPSRPPRSSAASAPPVAAQSSPPAARELSWNPPPITWSPETGTMPSKPNPKTEIR
jgi:CheY-like chemotaxis protein